MSQIQSLQTGSFKYFITSYLGSLRLRQSESAGRATPHARLLGLVSQLNRWNTERIAARNAENLSQELSIEDVHYLKAMIHAEVRKCALKDPEVVSDQLHFLSIGAIQVQLQTGSDKAWNLVSQSIQSFAGTQKEKRPLLLGLTTTALVICACAVTMSNTLHHPASQVPAESPVAVAAGATDPVTISTLLLAYNKMKSGTCQLPQAAMLPPEQRQAFLMFVNEGTIEVQHVENLRLALGYVNCLYPQELMHPVASTGNRL